MSRRANVSLRCMRCRVHASLCLCALIPRLTTRTRLVLIIHRYEDRKPTNTGRLAAQCLVNSEIIVRGHVSQPSTSITFPEESQPVLLFPHENAVPLMEFMAGRGIESRPLTLIVPDGTWRQASRVRNRVPGLQDVPCVTLPQLAPSIYQLRTEAREGGLATMEAISRAMGLLEGPHIEHAMDLVFRAMVDRTLWSRGEIETDQVTGSVPEGAFRHDPRSGLARGLV